jgi:hypothetical protein
MDTFRFPMFLYTLLVLAMLAGCQREEPPAVAKPPKKSALHVVVPEEVKAKWKAVRIVAHDKQSGRDLVYTVDVGGRFVLPETMLQVEVAHFLPAFAMDGTTATSLSNEPKNPGVEIVVRKSGEEIYRGWLFLKAPEDHAFEHPRYTLALQNFVARR